MAVERIKEVSRTIRRNPGYLILAALIIGALYQLFLPSDQAPSYARRFRPLTGGLQLLWQLDVPGLVSLPAADSRALYLYDASGWRLIALDIRTGRELWKTGTSSVILGVTRILADGDRVYIATATNAAAFSASTGELVWSTEIGDGHVMVLPDLAPDLLRIYYGQSVIEIARDTGRILSRQPLGNLLWIAGRLAINEDGAGLAAVDLTAAGQLWRSHVAPFGVEERFPPVQVLPGQLLVIVRPSAVCALDLRTGEYRWCVPMRFASNIIADPSAGQAFVLDDAWNLVSLDLATGAQTIVASFEPTSAPPTESYVVYTYALAISQDKLVVYLGDTRQVFLLGWANASTTN